MDSMNLIPYIEDERLYDYAVSYARSLRPDGQTDGRADARALKKHMQEIDRCRALLQKRARREPHLPAACEWLLDNHYLLQSVYPDALRALRAAERQRSSRGRLLVPELCRALLTAGNGKLTETRCEIFLKGFQSVTVLQRRELLLFPAALQSALAEWAAGLCRKLLASSDPEALTASMAALFTSLRRLGGMDLAGLLERTDVSAAILAAERDGSFARMDRVTRGRYLERLEELARRDGVEEQELARRLVDRADEEGRHVGFLLFSPPPERRGALYRAALLLLTVPVCIVLALDLELPLLLLLPENHDPARYEAEPFVLPADVCAARGREGAAGWTWYTGSAGWFFRVWTREVLGLELRDGKLLLRPAALERFRVKWTDLSGQTREIRREDGAVTVDGAPYAGGAIG